MSVIISHNDDYATGYGGALLAMHISAVSVRVSFMRTPASAMTTFFD